MAWQFLAIHSQIERYKCLKWDRQRTCTWHMSKLVSMQDETLVFAKYNQFWLSVNDKHDITTGSDWEDTEMTDGSFDSALTWNAQGKRSTGWLTETWRCTAEIMLVNKDWCGRQPGTYGKTDTRGKSLSTSNPRRRRREREKDKWHLLRKCMFANLSFSMKCKCSVIISAVTFPKNRVLTALIYLCRVCEIFFTTCTLTHPWTSVYTYYICLFYFT